MNKVASKLNWNRMLGFEQIADTRFAAPAESARLGAKVGGKVDMKVGIKA
jgi:hypothetical protein